MTVVLFLLCGGAFLLGADIFVSSKTIVDQVAALVLFLISALFFVGAAIVDAIGKLKLRSGPADPEWKPVPSLNADHHTRVAGVTVGIILVIAAGYWLFQTLSHW